MVKPKINVPIATLVAALLIAIGYDGMRLLQDQRFNDSLTRDGKAGIDGLDDTYRQFARAYSLRHQQDFKTAAKAYAAIEAQPNSTLHMDIKFNLANLYFREALRLRDVGDDDLAMPLIELAKENYKEILRAENIYWDAKYNLELALIVAPETDPVDPTGERNPERSPRAITKFQAREELP
ncbi:MAG: hypothetical protein OEM25_00855 [Gammaproteobacteria bacterium]|nr:hypothetical protein [Gammaproteobacteria bacterium]